MIINDVHRGITKNKKKFRVGRGPGSGNGKTAGRGEKGQGSRSGFSMPVTFHGGQNPLVRRIPKRGFNNKFAKTIHVINVGDLEHYFEAGDEVTLEKLATKNLAKWNFDLLKVLGDGTLTKKLKITAHRFSKQALEKIEKAGGQAITIPAPESVEVKKKAIRAAKKAEKKAAAK